MPDREPVRTTNIDGYGFPALPWSRAHDLLRAGSFGTGVLFVLGTVRPDGRPHAAGVGPVWFDGDLYFTSGPATRKARNLTVHPACTLAVRLEGLDLVFEGEAHRVSERTTLEQVADVYRSGPWQPEVSGDGFTAPFSAPSAGPPPWHLYRFRFHTVFGVATAAPFGATRWRFGP